MAWLWWLLAPVASTLLGAMFLWWRLRLERRRRAGPGSAIHAHARMLAVLAESCESADEIPMNMLLLPAPVDEAEVSGR